MQNINMPYQNLDICVVEIGKNMLPKDIEIHRYMADDSDCEDCEEENFKNTARWVVIGAGKYGYLYLCDMHLHDFIDQTE